MILKIALILFVLFLFWLAWSYWRELKYRKKPFYGLRDIGWRQSCPPNIQEKIHSIALVGDLGNAGPVTDDPVMQSIKSWLTQEGQKSTILFLGDNIYPVGLPPEGHRHYQGARQKLSFQLDLFKGYNGKAIYLSGNHDWNKGRKNGLSYVLRQEDVITKHLKDPTSYLPAQGAPGPVTWPISDKVIVIIINTQRWVQKGLVNRKVKNEFGLNETEVFFQELQALLNQNKDKFILVAAHHPLYSNALHGGKFTVKQQLFPLTFVHKKALIPLPLLGLAFRLYRTYIGATEDMSFPPYKRFRKRILKLLHPYNNVFYVGGHDHNLQYFQVKGNHYAVSGAGSKTNFVAKGGKATFSHEHKGFMVLDHYRDGSVWLKVLEPTGQPNDPTVVMFQKCVYPKT